VSDDSPTPALSPAPPTGRASLTYLTAGGDAPPPLNAANAHLLDQAAEYLAGMKALRSSALFDIVWGGAVLGLGLLMLGPLASRGPMYAPIRSVPLAVALAFAALGTILVAAGVWTCLKPNVTAMLIDGLILLLLFLLSAAFTFFEYQTENRPEIMTAITSFVILGAAVSRFRSINRFRQAAQTPLTSATATWLRELQRELARAHVRDDPKLVTFAANTFPIVAFKGRLLDDVAVCLLNNRLRFLTRDQLRASVISESPKWSNVRVTIDGRILTARLTPLERARLIAWQTVSE
jgi:hypothetical protein